MLYAVFNLMAAIKTLSLGNGYLFSVATISALGEIMEFPKAINPLYAFVN